jgi:hypothetical protein
MASAVVGWLLDSDPALRWQVERDLAHPPKDIWRVTRARVATEGFGARLLAQQDLDGQWAGCERRESRARRAEAEGAEAPFLCERRRSRRIHARDARAV